LTGRKGRICDVRPSRWQGVANSADPVGAKSSTHGARAQVHVGLFADRCQTLPALWPNQALEQAAIAREAEDLREALEERAAILEFDAGLPRAEVSHPLAQVESRRGFLSRRGLPRMKSIHGALQGRLGQDVELLNKRGLVGKSEKDYGIRGHSTESAGIRGSSDKGRGVEGWGTNSEGVVGISTNSHGVWGQADGAGGVAGTSKSGSGVVGKSESTTGGFVCMERELALVS
jgi:hypothetical protein